MGKDINQFIGTGRLGADPDTRKTRDDELVVNIRIACDNSYKDRDGKERGTVEWIPIVIFGHAADFVDKYLRKGDPVTVRGMFQTRKWKDKDDNDRYSTEIVINNFHGEIISTGGGGGRSGGSDRDDRDRDRDRGRDRDDRGGRDRDRGSDRGGRNDDRGRRDSRDDRDRDDRGGRDRDRDRGADRGRSDRDRDDRAAKDDRDRPTSGRRGAGELDDEIPF